jgi:hypothetical protein
MEPLLRLERMEPAVRRVAEFDYAQNAALLPTPAPSNRPDSVEAVAGSQNHRVLLVTTTGTGKTYGVSDHLAAGRARPKAHLFRPTATS